MSANETGEVLRSTVYRGAVGCIALATLPTLPIERLALRLHETLCLAISIVIGAVHGRAGANELFSNAVLRRIETIATKNVSSSAPSFGANLLSVENGNAIPVVNVTGHVFPSSNETRDQRPRALNSDPRSQRLDGKHAKRESQGSSRFAASFR